jgi:hypothetical protein
VSIECPAGCGCFHISGSASEYVRWCEPATVHLSRNSGDDFKGGVVRTIIGEDGAERMLINAGALQPGPGLPRYSADTHVDVCLDGASKESLALVIGVLLGRKVTAPASQAKEVVNERVGGTLRELMGRFGLEPN